ncbi:hypothetical protein [Bacillus sp. FJAT-52991]|uniref:Secreted protein n=1 Tax=Bacillus kandeliae TaxID=3129297 RepID=A0ABZ2N5X7_9BACI
MPLILSLLLTVAASRRETSCVKTTASCMGASVLEKDEGVVYTYGHRPASDVEGIDKKPPPQARDRWGRFIVVLATFIGAEMKGEHKKVLFHSMNKTFWYEMIYKYKEMINRRIPFL